MNNHLESCRVYSVAYIVIGRDEKIIARIKGCVIAMDVADLTDTIRRMVLGVEYTLVSDDGVIESHEVAERLEIESAQLIGRLHGVTDAADLVINPKS